MSILLFLQPYFFFIHKNELQSSFISVNASTVQLYHLFLDWLSIYFTSLICGCSFQVSTKVQSKNRNGQSSYFLKWITSHYLVTNSHFSKKIDGPFSSHVLWTISYCLFLRTKKHIDFDVSSKIEVNKRNGPSRYWLK